MMDAVSSLCTGDGSTVATHVTTPSASSDSSFGIVMSTRSDNDTSTQSSNTRSTRSRTLRSATKNQADTISKISKDVICNILSTENVDEIEIQLLYTMTMYLSLHQMKSIKTKKTIRQSVGQFMKDLIVV